MVNYVILSISILLAVAGQLLMKKGMLEFGSFPLNQLLVKLFPIFFNPYVFMGLFFFGLSSIFWLVVISRLQLSLVYPMVSVAYVLVAFASIIFFKEHVGLLRWLGITVIVFGVILISRS